MAKLRFTMETIAFQHDDFGQRFEKVIGELQQFVRKKVEETDDVITTMKIVQRTRFGTELSDLCMERFGLNIFFNMSVTGIRNHTSGVFTLPINDYHLFTKEFYRGDYDASMFMKNYTKHLEGHKGTIDLKTAKVTGIFSKYRHILVLGGDILLDVTTTPAMATAICLHEIGHVFTYYEYADRLSTTNQIMQNLATEIRTENRPEKREYWYRELAKETDLPPETFEKINNESNRTIAGYFLYQAYNTYVKSLMNSKYDTTAGEQTADNFAARFGYGKEIVAALQKDAVRDNDPEVSALRRFNMTMTEVSRLVVTGISIIGLAFIPGVGWIMAMTAFMIASMLFALEGTHYQDYTYDDLGIRFKRIRQQYIELLKNPELPPELAKGGIEQIKAIDELMKNVVAYEPLLRKLSDRLMSINKNTKLDIQQQQLMEELAHNDLFLKSAQLKTLSS